MNTTKGFTLIELIVYVALLSFLLTIITPTFINLMKRNTDLQARTIKIHEEFIYEE